MPSTVHGVDFSGARDAHRRIWVASGGVTGGRLALSACRPAAALPGWPAAGIAPSAARDAALDALRRFLAATGPCVVGLDFPFSLPEAVLGALWPGGAWRDVVADFGGRFATAEAFRSACLAAAGGRELRRATDRETATPFSAYNVRIYRQTFYGIRDVLAPLVREGRAAVVPFELPARGRPSLLEICPASTLARAGRREPYKAGGPAARAARARILAWAESAGDLRLDPRVRATALADSGGDALDSVLAALVAYRAAGKRGGLEPGGGREGRVYC